MIHEKYEDINVCKSCSGKLKMLGQVSEHQVFKCKRCRKEIVVNASTMKIESK